MMAGDEAYKGAIHRAPAEEAYYLGAEEWYLTNDDAALLAAESENVLWVSTIDQLRDELEVRYPADEPGLSRIFNPGYGQQLYVFPHAVLHTRDPQKVWDAVKDGGTICIVDSGWARTLAQEKLLDGCVFKFPFTSPSTVTFDPKRAAALRAKRAKKRLNTQVTVSEIAEVLHKLESATIPPFPHSGTYGDSSRNTYVNFLVARLVLFNVLYGRGAHRKFKPWQEFVVKWKSRQEASERVYKEAQLGSFVRLMATECKKRLPPALPPKHFDEKLRPKEIRLP